MTATGKRETKYDGNLKLQPWIQTVTGKKFHFLTDDASEVCIEDIATALSRMPRWAGHTTKYISVAQHSVLTSLLIQEKGGSNKDQMLGLLHDATEAYMCDIPKPLKNLMPIFSEIEQKVWKKISKHFFGKPTELTSIVHEADGCMLATEARDLFAFEPLDNWVRRCPPPWHKHIEPVGVVASHNMFINRYRELVDE